MPERSSNNKENRKKHSEYNSDTSDDNNQWRTSCEPNQQDIIVPANDKHAEPHFLSYKVSRPMKYVTIESRQLMIIILRRFGEKII